jgi:hypothetical protein
MSEKLEYDGFDLYESGVDICGRKDDKQYKIHIPWSQFRHIIPYKKFNLGRLDENSGVKLQLDLEGLKDMNKGLKAALEIIEEDDMNIPSSPITYEDIIKAIEKQKQDIERLSGDKE